MGSMGVTNIAATFSSPTGFLGRSVNQTRFLPATLPKLLQSSAVPTLHPRDPSAPRAGHMVTMVPPRQVVLPCLILLPPPLCQHSRLGSLMEGTMIQMHKRLCLLILACSHQAFPQAWLRLSQHVLIQNRTDECFLLNQLGPHPDVDFRPLRNTLIGSVINYFSDVLKINCK